MHTLLATACRAGIGSALAVLLFAVPVGAQSPPSSLELDSALQTLKQEVLNLDQALRQQADAALFPDQSRTSIYVSVAIPGFLLEEMVLRIDDGAPQRYRYTNSEARALLKDGWHRLHRLSQTPGAHRLTAEFRGRFHDSRDGDAPITGILETLYDKPAGELDLVLPVSRNSRLEKPSLPEIARLDSRRLRPTRNVWLPTPQSRAGALAPDKVGGDEDARLRSAKFLAEDQRYFSALGELLDIQKNHAAGKPLPVGFLKLLADCYLWFGMPQPAARAYQDIAATSPDPEVIALAQMSLAKFEYQRGYFQQASEKLRRLRDILPDKLRNDWLEFLVNSLLAQSRYAEAVQTFALVEDIDDLPPHLRYNYAVALVRNGQAREGRQLLNKIGALRAQNTDQRLLALRDKANLTLGYQFLESKQGDNAKAVFGRIRTRGPFSNHALLGLGWAELAPRKAPEEGAIAAEDEDDSLQTLLRPELTDAPDQALKLKAPKAVGLSDVDQDALKRALVPWLELSRRDPMDPAVQEGLLAIPWALDRLQAYEQSLQYFEAASKVLETARGRLDQAMTSIGNGRMVNNMIRRDPDSEAGWRWRLRDLVDTPENYYLQTLVSEHRFQESLKNFRDVRLLVRILDGWQKQLGLLAEADPALGNLGLEERIARLRQGWTPDWADLAIELRLDRGLAAPGSYNAPVAPAASTAQDLWIAAVMPEFAGPREALNPLETRLATLRAVMSQAALAHARELATISQKELEGQKKQVERYLTEARFSVARIYDRQQRDRTP